MLRGLPTGVRAFIRSVVWGGFAGALPYLIFTIPVGLSLLFTEQTGLDGLIGLYVLMLPLLISMPTVLAAAVLLGLPLTALLIRLKREAGSIYLVAGFLLGAIPFLVLAVMDDNMAIGFLAFSGGLGGGIAGSVWGRHRDEFAAIQSPD
jgi:hypothetical protein